jgi:TPP-dependent pyruvate/acetoin dehydrogenase alpha subunit
MDQEAIARAESAAEFADKSPLPEPSAIYENVYSDDYLHGIARRDRWRPEFEGS